MASALNVAPRCSDSRRVAAYDESTRLPTQAIQLVQTNAAPNRHRAAQVLPSDAERFREGDVAEVVCPEEKRAFCGRATQEIVAGGLDGNFEIVLRCERDAGLFKMTSVSTSVYC